MENLNISDAPPQGGTAPLPGAPPQAPAQLPPQMFTTAAQLLDLTDKKLMVVLRDGRKLIGVLRSWDQFANLVLQSTTERIFAPKPGSDADVPEGYFADIEHGIFLVRGENVLLLGEIDLDKDDDAPPGFEPADLEAVRRLAEEKKRLDRTREKKRLDRTREKKRLGKLATMGFEGENLGDLAF